MQCECFVTTQLFYEKPYPIDWSFGARKLKRDETRNNNSKIYELSRNKYGIVTVMWKLTATSHELRILKYNRLIRLLTLYMYCYHSGKNNVLQFNGSRVGNSIIMEVNITLVFNVWCSSELIVRESAPLDRKVQFFWSAAKVVNGTLPAGGRQGSWTQFQGQSPLASRDKGTERAEFMNYCWRFWSLFKEFEEEQI